MPVLRCHIPILLYPPRDLVLPLLFTAFLGTVNYFVLQFRQSPILPWDIASMGTALSVADHFSFKPSAKLVGILAAYLIMALF